MKLPDHVLLVCAEPMTKTVHYDDRASAVLWGDGAVAAVLSTKHRGKARLIDQRLRSDPGASDKVVVPRLGHFIRRVGRFRPSQSARPGISQSDLRDAQDEARNFHFVGHQANLRMLESVCNRCDIPEELHHSNCAAIGNTAGAGSGSVISQRWERWTASDDVASWGGLGAHLGQLPDAIRGGRCGPVSRARSIC